MAEIRVAIVEDEPPARAKLKRLLGEHDGYRVVAEADDVAGGVAALRDEKPDLLFLDIRLGAGNGFDVLTRAEKQLAESLLDNYPVSGLGSITTIAENAGVSTPTVVRMVQKLGFKVEGGAVQGIGQALCEAVAYDPDSGQLLSASFMDYALPRVDGFRGFRTVFDTSIPCTTNVLGAKGVGELGTIGATPAVVNAVVDALRAAGRGAAAQALQMPLTPERVWRALHGD